MNYIFFNNVSSALRRLYFLIFIHFSSNIVSVEFKYVVGCPILNSFYFLFGFTRFCGDSFAPCSLSLPFLRVLFW